MILRQAVPVSLIGQDFDDAAFRNLAAAASVEHADEFGLKRMQPRDAVSHRGQVLAGDRIHLGAGALRIVRQR